MNRLYIPRIRINSMGISFQVQEYWPQAQFSKWGFFRFVFTIWFPSRHSKKFRFRRYK